MLLTTIALLCCLVIQRFTKHDTTFKARWFESYLRILLPKLANLNEGLILVLTVLPILGGFLICYVVLSWQFAALFQLLCLIMLGLGTIDARDPNKLLTSYFQAAQTKQFNAAFQAALATQLLMPTPVATLEELQRVVTKTLLTKAFSKLFSKLFWFLSGGWVGVLTYTAIELIAQTAPHVDHSYQGVAKTAVRLKNFLDWLPARLVALSYSLGGNFTKSFSYWKHAIWAPTTTTNQLLAQVGLQALDPSPASTASSLTENHAAIDLINRALIIWLGTVFVILLSHLF